MREALVRSLRSLGILLALVIGSVVMVVPGGCTKRPEPKGGRVINLAIWSNYASLELLADFEKRTGIRVRVSHYSSNEELLAKLQAGAAGYDVIVPSDYMIFAMGKLGLLQPLDPALLPNAKSLDSKFLRKGYDPENRYSYPYDWGTTGIAVNRELFKGKLTGWQDLFETAELRGKYTLLDDAREAIGAALKAQGLSLNTKKPEDLARAKALLKRIKRHVKGFTSEPRVPLTQGETMAAHVFMSDALQARRAAGGGKIEYIFPIEGGTLWVDNLAIPKGAPHVVEAHAFIDFLLDPRSSVSTVMNVLVSPTSTGVFALLPVELQKDPVLFPKEGTLAKFEMMEDLGEALAAYDRVWTEVKSASDE